VERRQVTQSAAELDPQPGGQDALQGSLIPPTAFV
jgi:hypothetical protein